MFIQYIKLTKKDKENNKVTIPSPIDGFYNICSNDINVLCISLMAITIM